jgi:enoyl-CoA hydratase/carnithine racemase
MSTLPTFTSLLVTSDGPYRIVTLNRPERMNALSRTLLQEIGDAFRALANDRDARVIIMTGAGE